MILEIPPHIKKRIAPNKKLFDTRSLIKRLGIDTICESARCPNMIDCYSAGCATFLIMGKACTRACAFCSISRLQTAALDPDEPHKIARAVEALGLSYCVLTSPNRDDLADGGSSHFAKTIRSVRRCCVGVAVEALVPDFGGDLTAVESVVESGCAVFGHNIETVERLYGAVRPIYSYKKSLAVIASAKKFSDTVLTKSSIMVGIGESEPEVMAALSDLKSAGCDIVTIGQYLRPGLSNAEVSRFAEPDEFARYAREAERIGLTALSGPFVRSSYMAEELYRRASGRLTRDSA